MKIHKNRFGIKSLFLVVVAGLLFSVAACSGLNPPLEGGNGGNNSAVKTIKSVPGNFDIYDYFEDVYGFDKSKAYTSADEQYKATDKSFYYKTISHVSINNRAATKRVYHPFSTLLYEEFQYLLQSQKTEDFGYYAIVFGGEWEANTSKVLEIVNTAAAKVADNHNVYADDDNKSLKDNAFIKAIYNFDFKLSGGLDIEQRLVENGFQAHAGNANTVKSGEYNEYNTDIRTDLTKYDLGSSATNRYRSATNLYKTLLDTFNDIDKINSSKEVVVKTGDNLETTLDTLDYINSPSVILLKKEVVDESVKNTVVDYIDASSVNFDKESERTTFAQEVTDLISLADTGLNKFDFFRYIWGEFKITDSNVDYFTSNGSNPNFAGKELDITYNNLTDENHIYRTVTYRELIHLLNQEGNYAIYFGGAWCPYSKGFLAPLNDIAKSYRVNQIYVFDPRIDGVGGGTMIRADEAGNGLYQRLYINLLTYLGLDYNSYGFPSSHDYLSPKLGIKDEDVTIGGKKVTKITVPTLIGYNAANVNQDGKKQPLFGEASIADTVNNIVKSAAEPDKYGVKSDLSTDTRLIFSQVPYVEVARTSLAGRRQENNMFRFFDNFYAGQLTYKIAE